MLGSPSRAGSYAAMFVSTFAQMGCIVYLTFYFQNCFGYSPMRTGVVFLPMVGTLTLTAVIAGRTLVPRFGARFCFPVGLAVQAAGIGVLSMMAEGDAYTRVMLPGLLILGVGFGLVLPVVFNAGTRGVPRERAGLASAVISTCQQLGSSFGVALLSTFATRRATSYLTEHTDEIRLEAARRLAGARVLPTSAQGRQIVAGLERELSVRAQIDAYSAGLTLLAIIVASSALVLAIAVVAMVIRRVRRRRLPICEPAPVGSRGRGVVLAEQRAVGEAGDQPADDREDDEHPQLRPGPAAAVDGRRQ
jgi:Na+/melibiose symporter-like transporter